MKNDMDGNCQMCFFLRLYVFKNKLQFYIKLYWWKNRPLVRRGEYPVNNAHSASTVESEVESGVELEVESELELKVESEAETEVEPEVTKQGTLE